MSTIRIPSGELMVEGKTKKIFRIRGNASLAFVVSKDDITAGDGAKHDVIPGKGVCANSTTSNVFQLLRDSGIPVAFVRKFNGQGFLSRMCNMLPYEVVVRREAHGSYLKRYPHLSKGARFANLKAELYLKTNEKMWRGCELPVDDPLMLVRGGGSTIALHHPHVPFDVDKPFKTIPSRDFFSNDEDSELLKDDGSEGTLFYWARRVFLILERAWQIVGGTLVDLKIEFGIDTHGQLCVADVIDNDSWRVLFDGEYVDKERYRKGDELENVKAKYEFVRDMTGQFRIPEQHLVIWTGSEKDDVTPFSEALTKLWPHTKRYKFNVRCVVYSAHKRPISALEVLEDISQDSETVIIAYVGRSNGLGPMLAGNTTIPVITVPANVKEFPEDVWSSLRMPSDVPVLTVLEPKNAVLAALNILSARNPALYAMLRSRIEKRITE